MKVMGLPLFAMQAADGAFIRVDSGYQL